MTDNSKKFVQDQSKHIKSHNRKERLSSALRTNLRRRKEQKRLLKAAESEKPGQDNK